MNPTERRLQYVVLAMFVAMMLLGDLTAYYFVKEELQNLNNTQEVLYFLGISIVVSTLLILLVNGVIWLVNLYNPRNNNKE